MKIAVYPGSFDPITLGHLNIIKRASRIFDRVYVCVAVNSAKKPHFTLEERADFVSRVTKKYGNVEVTTCDGLLVEYARDRDGVPHRRREIYIPLLHHRQGDGHLQRRYLQGGAPGDRGGCAGETLRPEIN